MRLRKCVPSERPVVEKSSTVLDVNPVPTVLLSIVTSYVQLALPKMYIPVPDAFVRSWIERMAREKYRGTLARHWSQRRPYSAMTGPLRLLQGH